MFPSETYKELCIENQKALKWEPRPLDFVYSLTDKEVFCIEWPLIGWGPMPENWVWLPRLDQLMERLEERGYDWLIESKALIGKDGRYEAVLFGLCSKPDTKIKLRAEGPDPATALLKAYLEVVKKDGNTNKSPTY